MNNKYYAKRALREEKILMPRDTLVTPYINLDYDFFDKVEFPVIVKPNHEGSSVGISQKNVCNSIDEVQEQVNRLLPIYDEIIIEELIIGKDLTDLIIGNPNDIRINEAVITELHNQHSTAIYGALEKVNKLRTLYMADDLLETSIVEKISEYSKKIFSCLHASDIARIDYRISAKDNQIYFLEINSAPRFSLNTEVGYICKRRNWSVQKIIKEYLESSINRNFKL